MDKVHQILKVLQSENDLSLLAELYVGLGHDLQRLVGPWEFDQMDEEAVFFRRVLTSNRTIAKVYLNAQGKVEAHVFSKLVEAKPYDRNSLFTEIDKRLQDNNWRRLGTPLPHLTPWERVSDGWARFTDPLDPQKEPTEFAWVGSEDIEGCSDWRFRRLTGKVIKSDDMYLPRLDAMDYVDARLREDAWALP